MEPWELENLRRSIVMLPPGRSAGALSRDAALDLFDEVLNARMETDRYRSAVAQLRQVLEALDR